MYKRRQPLRDTVTHWVCISGIPYTNIQNIVNEQASFQMWDTLDFEIYIDVGNTIYESMCQKYTFFY